MEKSIIINSKEYKVPEINFGAICKLEKLGVNFNDIESQTFNFICGLVAYTIDGSMEKAGKEIDEHIKNGGSVDNFNVLIKAVTDSDFFQNLTKKRKK